MKSRERKKNIVLVDYSVSENNSDSGFLEGLRLSTGESWSMKGWNNNGLRKSKITELRRYLGYFLHPLGIVVKERVGTCGGGMRTL